MKYIDTLIIGAGISGLSYAVRAKGDYIIFEKDETAGGLCKTIYQDGFTWDYSGHFFHFATDTIQSFFNKEISLKEIVTCKKRTNIYYKGEKIDYPFQMNIHQLPKDEFIDCLYDLFNRKTKGDYNSFKEMLYCKFGESITDKFLRPYNEKLYACDLNELDPDAMGRFFPYADPFQIIKNMKNECLDTSYNSYFSYPKKGAQFFINILLSKIDACRLITGSCVANINPHDRTAEVNGEVYKYKRIVNTTPLNKFARNVIDDFSGYNLDALTSNKVLVFNLGFDKQSVDTDIHWTYFPQCEINFYRVGYYSNILKTDRMSLYVEIGFHENAVIDIEQQLALTLENLKKVGIITNHKLVSYCSMIISPAYVHITNESIKMVRELTQHLEKFNIYTIGRYGKWTYCSIEDCITDAFSLADTLSE